MKKWDFAFRVREWFLSPKNWDQLYEVGDSRECVTMFSMDANDIEAAKKHLRERAEAEDIELEILGLEYMCESTLERCQPKLNQGCT